MMELLQKTEIQAVLLTALFAIVGWAFLEWRKERRPKLGDEAKRLLEEIRRDARSSPKGITIVVVSQGMGFYAPFRDFDGQYQPGDQETNVNDLGAIRAGVEELVGADILVQEHFEGAREIYRLKHE